MQSFQPSVHTGCKSNSDDNPFGVEAFWFRKLRVNRMSWCICHYTVTQLPLSSQRPPVPSQHRGTGRIVSLLVAKMVIFLLRHHYLRGSCTRARLEYLQVTFSQLSQPGPARTILPTLLWSWPTRRISEPMSLLPNANQVYT